MSNNGITLTEEETNKFYELSAQEQIDSRALDALQDSFLRNTEVDSKKTFEVISEYSSLAAKHLTESKIFLANLTIKYNMPNFKIIGNKIYESDLL